MGLFGWSVDIIPKHVRPFADLTSMVDVDPGGGWDDRSLCRLRCGTAWFSVGLLLFRPVPARLARRPGGAVGQRCRHVAAADGEPQRRIVARGLTQTERVRYARLSTRSTNLGATA